MDLSYSVTTLTDLPEYQAGHTQAQEESYLLRRHRVQLRQCSGAVTKVVYNFVIVYIVVVVSFHCIKFIESIQFLLTLHIPAIELLCDSIVCLSVS